LEKAPVNGFKIFGAARGGVF
jgi:hypothetical protein